MLYISLLFPGSRKYASGNCLPCLKACTLNTRYNNWGQILNVSTAYIAVASERTVKFSLVEKKYTLFLDDRRNSSPLIVFAHSPSKCMSSILDGSGGSHSLLLL